ncbi:hypothetical protein M422DRAFT_34493 [Sphaerobolus stellatus SS14]|uniref:Costars domain-containing protein n=1 Tax=Sphaerobolus stellatus (strain SS14) TaxID=990650 RepID=A0A0C9ULC6_SPHS4|nr:hypothetical protein M422DRAFT_34493 [Sphaerobolus stellatus SS14]
MLDISSEIDFLKESIKRLGAQRDDGKYACPYGKLLRDDKVSNTLEALNGTLKAAKKQKKVSFDAELLLSPRDDAVEVVLLED